MTKADIFYKDIGDYLSREDKLKIVKEGHSILNPELGMMQLKPNEHGDWINERNNMFDEFIPIEPEKKFENDTQSFFSTFASAIVTSRDAWVCNYSEIMLTNNIKRTIGFYNDQRVQVEKQIGKTKKTVDDLLDNNPQMIS